MKQTDLWCKSLASGYGGSPYRLMLLKEALQVFSHRAMFACLI
jgi:hypothetical protein